MLLSRAYIQFFYIKLIDNQEGSGATPLHPFHMYSSLRAKACVPSRLQAGCSFGAPVCIFSLSLTSILVYSLFATELM